MQQILIYPAEKETLLQTGLETQFSVNVVSPYLLSLLFNDYLINLLSGKIINISNEIFFMI